MMNKSKSTDKPNNNEDIHNIIIRPSEFELSSGINEFNTFLDIKYKVLQELAFTNQIDSILANAVKKRFIKNERIMEVKIEVGNYMQKITDPQL